MVEQCTVFYTQDAEKDFKSINNAQKIRESIEIWAVNVKVVQTHTERTKRVYVSPCNPYQIWVASIGDPNARKGKSGGYRVLYILDVECHSIYITRLFPRNLLNCTEIKGSSGKKQKQWDSYLEDLKKELGYPQFSPRTLMPTDERGQITTNYLD